MAPRKTAPARAPGLPPRIDIHTHIEVPEVTDRASRIEIRGSGPGRQHWVPRESRGAHDAHSGGIRDKLTRPEARLDDMARMGVDIQVVSMNMPTPVYWAGARTGRAVARACNEGVAAFVRQMPDRFVGIGSVPLQDIGASVRELDHLVENLGLKGVQIPSNVRNHDLGEDHFRPFWARAEALGVPVIIHPRGFTHDDRLHKFFLWNTIGQPLEEALAMASLIHNGILDAYPGLKILMSHGGGYLPYYSGRGERAFQSRPEPRRFIGKSPQTYFSRFFYDSVIFDQDMLARLVRVAGAGRVMMGTDYPRGEVEDDPVGFVSTAPGLSDDDKTLIMSRNAMDLFDIKAPADRMEEPA